MEENTIINSTTPQNKTKKVLSFIWELVKIAIIAFVIVAPIRYFLFQPFIVSGLSMAPNFANGDYLIVDEISYRFSSPQRGDVVVFNADFVKGYNGEDFTNERFIKRVIGLPGDTVDITEGKVEIIKDGKKTILNEKYLPADLKTYGYNLAGEYSLSTLPKEVILKENEYFVLGDNRLNSYDSRYWGPVPSQYIIGKAAIRVLPITSLSIISTPSY
ncbi:MAG: signal peptidase I [Candidatus Staskawiczbacteria bacterium]|jgi:signal peptidase I